MIAHDCYLRRLPKALHPKERMTWETLVFASDVVSVAVHRFRQAAIAFDINTPISECYLDRAAMFSDAWTVVDGVHTARQMLRILTRGEFGPDTLAFYEGYAAAQRMRNKMDHLGANMGNLVARRGTLDPFFGALRFIRPDPDHWNAGLENGEIRAEIVSLASGSSSGEAAAMIVSPNMRIALPVGHLELKAFDDELALDLADNELSALLTRIAVDLEADIGSQIDAADVTDAERSLMREPASVSLAFSAQVGLKIDPT